MQASFCLDVSTGYSEPAREALIQFLRKAGQRFEASLAQRGRYNGVKKLRVITPRAEELRVALVAELPGGDDNDYQIHYSEPDAYRSSTWLTDYNHPKGSEPFELLPV